MFTLLQKLFSRSEKTLIWQQFADKHQGTLTVTAEIRVRYTYRGFDIILETNTHYIRGGTNTSGMKYIIARTRFLHSGEYQIHLLRKDFFSAVSKLAHRHSFTAGDKELDKLFEIKTTQEEKSVLLLKNQDLSQSLLAVKPQRVDISEEPGLFDEKPEPAASQIYIAVKGRYKTLKQLENTHLLINKFIDSLITLIKAEPAINI